MSNIVQRNGQRSDGDRIAETKKEFALAANAIARIVTDIEDLSEEEKEIRATIARKIAVEMARMKEIRQTKKVKKEQQSEAIGGYKLASGLLKRWKVNAPSTKLHTLAEKSETAKQLVGVNLVRAIHRIAPTKPFTKH